MEEVTHPNGGVVEQGAPEQAPASLHFYLRQETRADHAAVDTAFAAFDLASPGDYGRFLTAHARVLPRAEALTNPGALLPDWRGRQEALRQDLEVLGLPEPEPLPFELPAGIAPRWGAVYVLEGSRLGGAVLARTVRQGLPLAYLSAGHSGGSWQRLMAALEAAGQGNDWRRQAATGASTLFQAYLAAARTA